MSFRLSELTWTIPVEPGQKLILLAIAKHHNHELEDLISWPSIETLVKETGIPQSTLYRHLADLEDRKIVERLRGHPAAPPAVKLVFSLHISQNENHSHSENANSHFEKKVSQNENRIKEEPVRKNLQKERTPREPADSPADPAFARFTEEFANRHQVPYMHKRGDFVQLANLRHALSLDTRASPPDWDRAVSNYFDTPTGGHTLADLCTRYATFRQHALDRYKRPSGGENHETGKRSSQDTRQDDNLAAAHRLRSRIAAQDRSGV